MHKHPNYYKNVSHLSRIDVYRVLERFNIVDAALQHAVKKILVAGGCVAGEDSSTDIQDAIDSLTRFQAMQLENDSETFELPSTRGVKAGPAKKQKRR